MPTFHRGGLATLALTTVVLLAWGVAGCDGDTGDSLPPAPSPSADPHPVVLPTPQLTPEEQQAVAEVTRLFDEFMRAYVDLATSGAAPSDDALLPIGTRSIPPLFSAVNTELVDNYLARHHLSGTLEWEFLGVVDIRLSGSTASEGDPQLRLRYCLDATDWVTIHPASNQPVPGNGFLPAGVHQGVVRAVYFDRGGPDDPRWYLTEWVADSSAGAC